MTQSAAASVAPDQSRPLPVPPGPSAAEGESRRRAGRRVLVIGALVVVALAGALAVGTLPRLRQRPKRSGNADGEGAGDRRPAAPREIYSFSLTTFASRNSRR